jgi:hypothetical protein
LRLALTTLGSPLAKSVSLLGRPARRLEDSGSVRLKRHAEGDLLALAGADDPLNIRLIHVGWTGKHLRDADRITQIWEFLESNREDVEQIPRIWDAMENLEDAVSDLAHDRFRPLRRPWDEAREEGPPITADQAQEIRALLKETGVNEGLFLGLFGASSVENIRGFARARGILQRSRRATKKE